MDSWVWEGFKWVIALADYFSSFSLLSFGPNHSFIFETDASGIRLCTILSQVQDHGVIQHKTFCCTETSGDSAQSSCCLSLVSMLGSSLPSSQTCNCQYQQRTDSFGVLAQSTWEHKGDVNLKVGDRVMVLMPAEAKRKKRKPASLFHGPFSVA